MYVNRLKELRENNEIKQSYISSVLGIKQQQYSRYENNQNDLPTGLLIDIAIFYNISVDYVLGLTNVFSPFFACPFRGSPVIA